MNNETQPQAPANLPIAGAQPKSAMIGFTGDGIAISTLEQAFLFAKSVVASPFCPKNFTTPEAVMVAIQFGAELGLKPMAALQNIAVINGKPGLYGDAGKALLRSRGFDIEEMDSQEIKEKGFARCTITHPRQKPVTRSFSVEDAKAAGLWGKAGPWQQYPARQLAWRAFWFAARDAAADVLRGLSGAEEVADLPAEPKNVTPPAASERLSALNGPSRVEAVPAAVPAPEKEQAPAPAPTPVQEAPVKTVEPEVVQETGDKQTVIDLIEGRLLDTGTAESAMIAAAKAAGKPVPAKVKKFSDLELGTLEWILGELKKKGGA